MTVQQVKDKSDFTKGSIPQNIVRMAIPMTIAVLINAMYSIVDRIYLGHIPGAGSYALTGIGLSFPIISLVTAFTNLFGNGGSPLFAIASGKGDKKTASVYLNNAAFMLVVSGVFLTVVTYAVKGRLLWLIGASSETFPYANGYLNIYLLGTVLVMVSLGLNPYINAQGHSRIGMFTVMIGAVVNIVLDPIFIFAFGMGIKGAAIATVIAQACSAAWVLRFLTGKKVPIRLDFRGFRPDFKVIGRIMGLGVAEFCFQLTNSAVSMFYNSQLQLLGGDAWVGAMTVVNSVREVGFAAATGITGAAKPIMSYNYGAKRYDRVVSCRRWCFSILFGYFALLVSFIELCPGLLAGLFTNVEAVYDCSRIAMRVFFCMEFCMAFQSTGQGTFTALGMAKFALFFSLFRKALLVIPLTFIMPHLFGLGVIGVFAAEPVSDVLGGLSCYITMSIVTKRKFSSETGAVKGL